VKENKTNRLNEQCDFDSPYYDPHTRVTEYEEWVREETEKYEQRLKNLFKSQGIDKMDCDSKKRTLEVENTRLSREDIMDNCNVTLADILQRINVFRSQRMERVSTTQYAFKFYCNYTMMSEVSSKPYSLDEDTDPYKDIREPAYVDSIPWDSIIIENGKVVLCKNLTELSGCKEQSDVEEVLFRLYDGKIAEK